MLLLHAIDVQGNVPWFLARGSGAASYLVVSSVRGHQLACKECDAVHSCPNHPLDAGQQAFNVAA